MADVKQRVAQDPKAKSRDRPHEKIPPAGPHAKPGLTDAEKTPGSGALGDPERQPKSTEAPTG